MTLGEIVEAEGGPPDPVHGAILTVLKRLDRIEDAIEFSHRDREEYAKNDLPWRHELVQRAAKEIDHPVALETTIKGRCFREGMATMLVWLWDHPEAVAELAERRRGEGLRAD